jgi:DNA-binding transcriptional LysR family regulator
MKPNRLQDIALRYFLEVVRCKSISEASQHLNVASSAISRQIAGLEALLDTPLFERLPRGMLPNAAGEILAVYARKSAREAERAFADIEALKGLCVGNIRLASAEGFAVGFLPRAIGEFQQRFPKLVFELHVSPPAEVSQRIRDGSADLGITFSRLPEREIKVEYRQPAPLLAIMRRDHPLARFGSLSLAQLSIYPLALAEHDTTLRQLFDFACSQQQISIEPTFTCNVVSSLHNYISHTGAISVSGELTVRHCVASGEFVAIPLKDRALQGRNLEVQTRIGRQLPRMTQLFLDELIRKLPKAER